LTMDLATHLCKDVNSILLVINVQCDNTNKAEYKISNVKFHN